MALRTALITFALATTGSILAAPSIAGATDTLFTLQDPAHDDHGDGSLIYPGNGEIGLGDLDITALKAEAMAGGTMFEARFYRRVQQPIRRAIDGGGTLLTDIARLGFYTFNIDIYIDTDRKPGSGRTAMLPGRKAEVQPDFAWEKVICLTPRPNIAQAQLRRLLLWKAKKEFKAERGRLTTEDASALTDQIDLDISRDYFFPTRVSVSGPKIRFFVPSTFLAGTAKPSWAYVVAVSGADLEPELQLTAVDTATVEMYGGGLMIVPVVEGGSLNTFGSRSPDVEMLPPLVDIIVPPGVQQEVVLKDYDILANRPVRLPGVVPAEVGAATHKR